MKSLGSLLISLLITFELLASSEALISLVGPEEPVFVGEPFSLELILKRCGAAERVSPIFVEPEIRHVWLKKVYKSTPMQESDCSVSKRRYVVTAQQSGLLRIAPAEVRLAVDNVQPDAWGDLKTERYWQSHYSNELELQVKPLAEGISLVGSFSFRLDVEKREIAANAALKAEMVIEGVGNFEDIVVSLPSISGVNIFTDAPELEYIDKGDRERWRQSITFTAEEDFIIPSVSLVYFDLKEQQIKTVQTQAVPIHVLGGSKALLPRTAEVESVPESRDDLTLWIVMCGIIGIVFVIGMTTRAVSGRHQTKKVSYRDHKALLHLLLLHKDDEGIEAIIEELEASVYEGKEMRVDKKELKRLIKKYC